MTNQAPNPDDRYTVTVTVSRNPASTGAAPKVMTSLTYPGLDYCSMVEVEAAIVGGLVSLGRQGQKAMGCRVATADAA